MHELYELKDMLMKELEGYGSKELSTGSLDVIDKLAHTLKNLCKIIEEDEGYSNNYPEQSYQSYRRSYARGGGGGNRGGNRGSNRGYSMRYSRDGLADKLRELMAEAPDDRTRDEIERLVERVEK